MSFVCFFTSLLSSFLTQQSTAYCVLSCLYRVSWKCLDFDSAHAKPKTLIVDWFTIVNNVKIDQLTTVIIKGFGRRKMKESRVLFPPSLTIYLQPFCLLSTQPQDLCCTVCPVPCFRVVLTSLKIRRIAQVARDPTRQRTERKLTKSSRLTPEAPVCKVFSPNARSKQSHQTSRLAP